jgi:hypothetical protein
MSTNCCWLSRLIFSFSNKPFILYIKIYAYVSLIIFCVLICRQFCEYLQIYCFQIGRRAESAVALIPDRMMNAEAKQRVE